jgi:FkbM family methyltransferase
MNMIRSLIGKLAVQYAYHMPNHRGRFRAFAVLDRLFGPFHLRTPAGPMLEIFLSSSMDLSYYRPSGLLDSGSNNLDLIVPQLISRLLPGECYVDVGANIGWLTCLAAVKLGPSGRVVAIEPSAREYLRLLRGLALNRVANVIPVHGAFGADASVGILEVAAAHTGLNHLTGAASPVPATATTVHVPVWTGDALLPPLVGARPVGLVKIDTEGAELLVLTGMQRFLAATRPRHVVVEITPEFLLGFGAEKSQIYDLMSRLGFQATIRSESAQYDEVFVPAGSRENATARVAAPLARTNEAI